jgi:hypothetical protein
MVTGRSNEAPVLARARRDGRTRNTWIVTHEERPDAVQFRASLSPRWQGGYIEASSRPLKNII